MVQFVTSRAGPSSSVFPVGSTDSHANQRMEILRRPVFKRFRSIAMRNNICPAAFAIQITFIGVIIISYTREKNGVGSSGVLSAGSQQLSHALGYSSSFEDNTNESMSETRPFLPEPSECSEWRSVATDVKRLRLYMKHFTSLEKLDWFLYVSIFNEEFQERAKKEGRRPRYLDLAANRAKRWSNTFFFDRCQGWEGVCIEPNPIYQDELESMRTCSYIQKCISDIPREVVFAFGEAYGGIVKNGSETHNLGVQLDTLIHKKADHFSGTERLVCSTLANELAGKQHFDFLSLNVQGFELPALQGVDWSRMTIDVIAVKTKSLHVWELLNALGYDRHVLMSEELYIRRGTGYKVDPLYVEWLTHVDNVTGAIVGL